MAAEHQSNSAINYNDPYSLSTGDNSNSQLGQIVFNGNNYFNWSRSVQLALGAKNKVDFINGTLLRPDDASPDLQKWIRNDYMVTGWILYTIEKQIAESFIFAASTRQLWLEIQEMYEHSTAPQLYKIHKSLMSIEQNDASIANYYAKLKKVWDQLQMLDHFPDCSCGAILKCSCGLMKKILEADQLKRLIQLISGLKKSYDQAKINILSMDPLPSVNKAYHMLQQIEKQSNINLLPSNLEMSALMSMRQHYGTQQFQKPSFGGSSSLKKDAKDYKKIKQQQFCDHCRMKGHLKENCFKIVGYPDWYKGKQGQSSSNTGRFTVNVQEASSAILGSCPVSAMDSPLDLGSGETCTQSSQMDPNYMSAMYKKFVKMKAVENVLYSN